MGDKCFPGWFQKTLSVKVVSVILPAWLPAWYNTEFHEQQKLVQVLSRVGFWDLFGRNLSRMCCSSHEEPHLYLADWQKFNPVSIFSTKVTGTKEKETNTYTPDGVKTSFTILEEIYINLEYREASINSLMKRQTFTLILKIHPSKKKFERIYHPSDSYSAEWFNWTTFNWNYRGAKLSRAWCWIAYTDKSCSSMVYCRWF